MTYQQGDAARAYVRPDFDDLPRMRALLGLAVNDRSEDDTSIAYLRREYLHDRAYHTEQWALKRLHANIMRIKQRRG